MKIFKILSKRGLALFLVLTMCMSLLPTTALAAELAEATHTHNEDGWICVEESKLICEYEEHTHDETCWETSEAPEEPVCGLEESEGHQHDEACYAEEASLTCGQEESEEHTHDEACYSTETVLTCTLEETEGHAHGEDCFAEGEKTLVCELEEHKHGEKCYESEWTCTEPSDDVKAFLRAVKAIPEEITPENVEEAEARIAEATEAWQHMSGADRTNASVVEANAVLENAKIAVEAAKEAVPEEPVAEEPTETPVQETVIPEGAVVVTPDKLLKAAVGRTVTMESFFGLVQSSNVVANKTPESLTFVVGGEEKVFTYKDANTYTEQVAVTESAILLDNAEATVYAQGEAAIKDGAETLAEGLGSTYGLTVELGSGLALNNLQTQINAASEIILTSPSEGTSYTFTGTLTIPTGKTVTVKNTAIWRGGGTGYDGPLFRVESGAMLNLESMFLHGTENDDKCTERYDAQGLWAKGPLVEVCSDGILNLNNGAYLHGNGHNGNGGGVYVHSGGTLNFNEGAQIVNCDAVNGGGVCLENDAAVNLWNASIEGCRAIGGSGDDVWYHTITGDSRLDGKKIVVTVLASSNIPGEPSVSQYGPNAYTWVTSSYTVGNTDEVFSNNAATYIRKEIFSDPNFAVNGGAQGVGSSAEKYLIGIDWDQVCAAVAGKGNVTTTNGVALTTGNQNSYTAYPYVAKLQEDGWHIDCVIVPKDDVKLTYELNLQGYIDNLNGFEAPSGKTYAKGATVTVDSAMYKEQPVKVGEGISVTKDGKNATLYFLGWRIDPPIAPEEAADYMEPDETFAIQQHTTLYGVWATEYTTYTVKFDVNGGKETITDQTVKHGEKATEPTDPAKDQAVFEGWTLNGSAYDFNAEVTGSITLVAQWADDKIGTDPENPDKPDGVPDKYQVTVVFASINGTVDGKTQAERVVTLVDSEGKWSETGSYTLTAKDIPAAAPVDGYTGEGTWDVNPEGVEISKDSEKLYFVITFERERYKTFVEFYFDGEKDEAVTIEGEDYFESILTITPEVELDHNGKHYALDKVENNDLRVSTDTAKNVVSVYYGLDENADMVPDKYQVSVMFAGVNGTVDGKTQAERVVTLVDDDGKWSETGSYSLTDEDIPVTAPAEGYTGVGAWDVNPEGVEISKDSEKLYFVITFEREQYKTFVEFYFDGEKDEDVTIEGEDYFESILTITPEVELDHNGKHYALDKVENNDLRVSTDPAKNVVSVYYGLDENADMVPDKYQVTVTYTATNGSVSFSQVFVTLFDGEGNWSENGTGYLTEDQIPIATSNTGYVGKMWTPEEPTTEVAITGNVEFHVEWSKGNFNYTVNYLNEEGGAVLHDAKTESARFESVIASADEVIAIDGYVFDHASVGTLTIGADAARNVINLYYAADTMVDPTVPEGDRPTTGGDGIADKYQARVTFVVENGTWTGGTTSQSAVVTLMKGGVPAVDGTYRIPADRVPNSNPNMGYLRGSWDRNPNGAIINGDTKFTFTYALIPVIPPVTPPGGGGGGGGTTIPDGPTPLVPDPGTTITDQDVPLAAPGLNNTDHFDYIKGYVIDGQILVRPEANITRAEVATIFFRLMTKEFREANWATENDFTDVKKGDWYNNAISTCTKAGILKGYEDGTFKPNQTISREEFAAIAARFASEEVPAGGMFKDIAGRWSEKDIERAAAMGWIKGSNGLFRPVDKITRAEVIVIVNRMLDRVPDADHMLPDMKTFADNTPDMWWYADVQEATNSHEYDRAEDGVTGIWTSLLPEQDWAALEEEWATAADTNVADVAPKPGAEGEKPEEGAKEPETAGGSDGNGEE